MSSGHVVPKGDGVLVRLRVSPGAKSTGLQGACDDGALRANAEAERFLAGLGGAVPSEARVVRGSSARDKAVSVGGEGAARAREAISSRPA